MSPEYKISRITEEIIYSPEMFPPEEVGQDMVKGLGQYEFYKETGNNMLSVLREDFMQQNPNFSEEKLKEEVKKTLKLSAEEQESVLESDDFVKRYLEIRFIVREIKPSFVAEVFRNKGSVYAGKTMLEVISEDDGAYILGRNYWRWTGTG